ncbi:uncharacterized protein RJT21DRAFT_118482 [Scheffersomyces amazonensis]|uniref:uncharacterized protein n=1 Tax=Scheffersomyces amazonensis TaxID=1078765 RepID=UPI00315D96A1
MSTKPLWYRWARVYFAGGSIIGTGVLLYIYTTPTDEQLIASFSPEIRADYEMNKELRRRENQEFLKIIKETSSSNDPIWKTGPIGSPLERSQRNANERLIDYDQFRKEEADKFKQNEIEQANLQLIETEKLKQKQSSGWFNWLGKK